LPLDGGMAIYAEAPSLGHRALIDCGPTNCVEFTMKPFLRARGLNRLPNLVLTHGDARHVAAAPAIASLFPTEHVCISPLRSRSPVYRRVIEAFNLTPEKTRTISRDDHLGPWSVLHPAKSDHF